MKDRDKIALFIDADNAPAKKIDKILSELARYGYKKLSDLFMAIDLFEMKKTHNSVLWVRDKAKAKQRK